MTDEKKKADSVGYSINSEIVPTKELLKSARKRDYEKAKAARKSQRLADKEQKKLIRAEERAERDKSLWASMKRGSDLPEEE